MENPFITRCDECGKPTWYETEQPCHMDYVKREECNLGYYHEVLDEDECVIREKCTGTLRLIKPLSLEVERDARRFDTRGDPRG